jgi:mannose-6-phosphate isomerase-like protein (cupin superfamily)
VSKKSLAALAGAALVAGCATSPPNPRLLLRYEKGTETLDTASFVARAAGAERKLFDLGRTAWVSHHLAVIRTAEQPHYHRFHDLTITVLRGDGVLSLDGKRRAMKAGDVAHVHRGVRHFFRNTGDEPAAAFLAISPPYDGRDTVTADVPAEPAPVAPRGWWPWRSAPEVESTGDEPAADASAAARPPEAKAARPDGDAAGEPKSKPKAAAAGAEGDADGRKPARPAGDEPDAGAER